MKAIQVTGKKSDSQLTLTNSFPQPIATGAQILIKVYAAGITADELTWPELYASSTKIPGHDVSGVVEAVGPDYDGPLSVGSEVYAMLRASADQGGQAEYVTAAPEEVTPKPMSISHVQAAALPIPILTAWEAIYKHAKLQPGSRILVTGASGAVGLMLVQLAYRLFGAEVIGLASPRNHGLLTDLGVSLAVDYNLEHWENRVGKVDAVFDTVGGRTLNIGWNTVKEGGVVVTVADPPPPWAFGGGEPNELKEHPRVRWVYFIVSAQGKPLATVATLIDNGTIRPIPVKAFQAAQALKAWEYALQRSREGKAVIQFMSSS